jgi:transposase
LVPSFKKKKVKNFIQVGGSNMAGKRFDLMQIRELLRHLRASASNRQVHRDTGVHRDTVKKYRAWAAQHDLLDPAKPLPSLEELHQLVEATLVKPAPPAQSVSSVEPYRQQVETWHSQGVEGRAIWYRLREQGYTYGVSSVYRFLAHLDRQSHAQKLPHQVTVRVEHPPGEEAQVDFGEVGRWYDPATKKYRKVLAFVMTLSFSRHIYVEFVYHQDAFTWSELHRHAFEFFGRVPRRVVVDNLKAAVTQTSWDGHDPTINITYRECAEHYGFLIAPCRPRMPEHKGKVESNIHYVQRNFVAGQTFEGLAQANQAVRKWCLEVAGERIHGTTKQKPLVLFQQEKEFLLPLPSESYVPASWKQLKVHRDCYVTFEGAYYSVPFRLVGQLVRVRAGAKEVKIYTQDYAPVATHSRAAVPGERITRPDHLPSQKLAGLTRRRGEVLEKAKLVGPHTEQIVRTLLEDRVVDRLHSAGSLLELAKRPEIGTSRLEAACQRAVTFGEYSYRTVRRILDLHLESELGKDVAVKEEVQPVAAAGPHFVGTTFAPIGPGAVPIRPATTREEEVGEVAQLGHFPSSPTLCTPRPRYARSAQELLGHLFKSGVVGLAVVGSWLGATTFSGSGGGGVGWS